MWPFPRGQSVDATGQRIRRSWRPASEPLEDRAMMSGLNLLSLLTPSPPATKPILSPAVVSGALPKNVSGRIADLYELSLTEHPQYQSLSGSRILEAPEFNAAYTGPKLADLDVVGADAVVTPQKAIQFTGLVLGPINVSQQGIYSFLVDRGGARSPGPIKGQPGLTFDAVIQVTIDKGQVSGEVSLLNSQDEPISTTALPADSVQIAGDAVRVTVPLNLLPSTAPPSIIRPPSMTPTRSLPACRAIRRATWPGLQVSTR